MSTTEHQDAPVHHTPEAIRDQTFDRRMLGGLDQDRVYGYLDRLADQAEATERELEESRTENERLRGELQRVQGELDDYEQVGERVNEQVVQLFSQAQLVAEQMVEDSSRDSRERIDQARAHERKIVEEALDTAGQQVSSYARSAQAQMRSIVDSFATEVERLGTSRPEDPDSDPVDTVPEDWTAPPDGRGPESAGSR